MDKKRKRTIKQRTKASNKRKSVYDVDKILDKRIVNGNVSSLNSIKIRSKSLCDINFISNLGTVFIEMEELLRISQQLSVER